MEIKVWEITLFMALILGVLSVAMIWEGNGLTELFVRATCAFVVLSFLVWSNWTLLKNVRTLIRKK